VREHVGTAQGVAQCTHQLVHDVALVRVLRQFDLGVTRLLGDVQPRPLVLYHMPHHIQVAHHDDQ